jgi:hypothetical protein
MHIQVDNCFLTDNLSLGAFTKELDDSERKILESFETKRQKVRLLEQFGRM